MARTLEIPIRTQSFSKISGLKHVSGEIPEKPIFLISTAELPEAGSLVFASSQTDLQRCLTAGALLIIAKKGVSFQSTDDICIYEAENLPQTMSEILKLIDPKSLRWPKGLSPRAQVHPTAYLGKDISIADFAVIGEGARVGDRSTIGAHAVIERQAVIGQDCFIHSHAVIGADCIIGSRVEIHSNTTIGSDGFGFIPQKNSTHLKLPQIGTVTVEDDVEIGANCAIDRATITTTTIKSGSKLDNLVHIAHNCVVGPNSRLAAGFFLAGSSKLGANFLAGGSSVVSDHVTICDNVTLGGRSVVTKDITQPGIYAGYPLEPVNQAMRTIANIAHLTDIRKQVQLICKKIGLTSEQEKT